MNIESDFIDEDDRNHSIGKVTLSKGSVELTQKTKSILT